MKRFYPILYTLTISNFYHADILPAHCRPLKKKAAESPFRERLETSYPIFSAG